MLRRQIATEGCWHALHWRKLDLDDSGLISVQVNGETIAESVLHVKSKYCEQTLLHDFWDINTLIYLRSVQNHLYYLLKNFEILW